MLIYTDTTFYGLSCSIATTMLSAHFLSGDNLNSPLSLQQGQRAV